MKQLNWATLGCGVIANELAHALSKEGRTLYSVANRTHEKAVAFAQKYGISKVYDNIDDVFYDPDVDIIYISTPHNTHINYLRKALYNGKHVLCEKPFASNAWEVREMIAASAKYDVTLMEAMKPTLTPNFRSVRENLGRLGTIRRYFSCYCQYSSRYDKFKEGVVLNAFRPELSNGAMMDIGIYTVYPLVVVNTISFPETFSAV